MNPNASVATLQQGLQDQGIHTLLVQFTDVHGCAKGKLVPLAHLGTVLGTGAGFAGPSIWGTGLPRSGPRSEFYARGDARTLQPLPWLPGVARIVGDGFVDGQPFEACPRQVLRRQQARLAERGWQLQTGLEPEFFLLRRSAEGAWAPADALDRLDPARPIVVEAESSRIGRLALPPILWSAMKAAPRLVLNAPIAARVARVLEDYAALEHDAEARDTALRRLPSHHSRETVEAWRQLSRAGDLRALAAALMQDHYDPAYRRAARDDARPDLGEILLSGCGGDDLDRAADAVAQAVGRL